MRNLEKFEMVLFDHKKIQVTSKDGALIIKPLHNDGFTIEVLDEGEEYSVFCDGWHEHIETAGEVEKWVRLLLSKNCRIKQYLKSGEIYKGEVQEKVGENWIVVSVSSSLFYPFWKKTEIRYLSNSISNVASCTVRVIT